MDVVVLISMLTHVIEYQNGKCDFYYEPLLIRYWRELASSILLIIMGFVFLYYFLKPVSKRESSPLRIALIIVSIMMIVWGAAWLYLNPLVPCLPVPVIPLLFVVTAFFILLLIKLTKSEEKLSKELSSLASEYEGEYGDLEEEGIEELEEEIEEEYKRYREEQE